MPLLALLVVLARLVQPVAAPPSVPAWPAVSAEQAFALSLFGSSLCTSQPDQDGGGTGHDICHFCRLQDAGLPPPSQHLVPRTAPPVVVAWASATPCAAAPAAFLSAVQARAPPFPV